MVLAGNVSARKDLIKLLARRAPAVLADLERFGVLDFDWAVAALQRRAGAFAGWTSPGFQQPLKPAVARNFPPFNPREPFVELRSVRVQCAYFLLPHIIDCDRDIGNERRGELKRILQIQKQRVMPKGRGIRTEARDHHQVGRILNQLAGVAMIRMIIPGAMRQDDIGVPAPDTANDIFPGVQRRQQLAVVVPEDFGFRDPQTSSSFPGFGFPDSGEFGARMEVMTRRAVGHGEEFHGVSRGGKLIGRAAELDLAIVRVRPDADYPHRI